MSVNYGGMSEEDLLAPEFYYAGNRYSKSDLGWIKVQLQFLTLDQKRAACSEYREVYLTKGRKVANKYLSDLVSEVGCGENVKASSFGGVIPPAMKEKIDRIRAAKKRPTILGISDSKK